MGWLNRLPMWAAVMIWIVIGLLVPTVCGLLFGIREASDVLPHDAHAYLLQADTFRRGRLTNPSPSHPEFFESIHILVEPSYQAKYPPGQAVFMAIGARLFGHPIWGVRLNCGLFAGSLYWMLSSWTRRQWAAVGTVLAISVVGSVGYWADSYWGGMTAAFGGALLFGGTGWTIRRWTPLVGFLSGLGVAILANSRPLEGAIACLGCVPLLLRWLFEGPAQCRLAKLVGWCGPFLTVVAAGLFGMSGYNQAVTGHWNTMPYSVHMKQYFTCGIFRWQPINQIPERNAAPRLREYYEATPTCLPGTEDGPQLGSISVLRAFKDQYLGTVQILWGLRISDSANRIRFWIGVVCLALLTFYLVTTAFFLSISRRWEWLHLAWIQIILSTAAESAAWWQNPHYLAPIACLFYFVAVDWLRRVIFYTHRLGLPRRLRKRQLVLTFCILPPLVFSCGRFLLPHRSTGMESTRGIVTDQNSVEILQNLRRGELLEFLAREKHPVLAFVSYAPDAPVFEEWVYNSADLHSQRVLLAHDLGSDKNSLLIKDFPEREIRYVHVTTLQAQDEKSSSATTSP